ncbi:hypothetical protein IC617_11800 [Neiella sp. HB171785]|uniref:Uncharacterized protein n=1 Tax=Neiella litorisoli TaxID=2771431 RepID=A0A8J6QJ68_9GAMM|nr:DUF6776 family protein [Neiella litorisoli]MBD1390114.1 hypothetical protein [Neiella litorisoli]
MWIVKQLHHLIKRILALEVFRTGRVTILLAMAFCVMAGVVAGRFGYDQQVQKRLDAERQVELAELHLQENQKITSSKDISLRMVNAELTWLQEEIKRLGDEKQALTEELNLYRKVFRDGGSNDVMAIDSATILNTNAANVFRFRITLIQLGRFDRPVKGELSLSLFGIRSEQPVQFDTWALVAAADKASLQFSFRYLTTIEGIIQVPDDVVPEQLELQTKLSSMPRSKSTVTATYEWRDIVQADF